MLLSVFTPSHDATYLHDAFQCLREQTHQEWEWLVVANGDKKEEVVKKVNEFTAQDPRVRVLTSDVKGVGALKRVACEAAKGDIFVEYDHDDLLTKNCLATVAQGLGSRPDGFLYSDDVQINHNHESAPFNTNYGWQHYEWEYEGRKYTVSRQFEPDARSLAEILYAPDHVRAWSRGAYFKAGGHNPELAVADDHELMIKTYLAGCEFVYIQQPLYFHRQNGVTTSQVRVDEIQRMSRGFRDKYLYDLIREWCRRRQLPIYSVGEDLIPAEKAYARQEPDWSIKSVKSRKPIDHDSAGCIVASEFLQMIPRGRAGNFFACAYNLLVAGGFLVTFTPSAEDAQGRLGRGAYQDERHQSMWTVNNFLYYTNRNFNKFAINAPCRFQCVRQHLGFPSPWHEEHHIPYITWDGMALKDDHKHRLAGYREI